MTTHYIITLTNYRIDFKATYRDGKFRKLEHLRGRLNQQLMNSLGKVIPQQENELSSFIVQFKGRVSYEKIEAKPATLFTQFQNDWFVFYRKENNNVSPMFDSVEGKALKGIIAHFKMINNGNENEALANWKLILNNWNSLSEFHQKMMELKYIKSKLNVIIREIIKNNQANSSESGGTVRL